MESALAVMPHARVAAMLPAACLQDRGRMYSVGSLFYAIYFFVSFPMFYRMDEDPKVRAVESNSKGFSISEPCAPLCRLPCSTTCTA